MLKLIRSLHFTQICVMLLLMLFIPASILLLLDSREQSFLLLNQTHNGFFDFCFIRLTFLGDGLFSIVVAALVLVVWKNKQMALEIMLAFLISGLLAQIIKHAVGAPRPKALLNPETYHYFFPGITNSGWNSFPSGHTTSIFALATVIVLHSRQRMMALACFLVAVLVGFSRIYLGQHFLVDVTGGAILGILIACLVVSFVPANLFQRKSLPTFEGD